MSGLEKFCSVPDHKRVDGREIRVSPKSSPDIQGVWGRVLGQSQNSGRTSYQQRRILGAGTELLYERSGLFVFGSGVALVGVQLTEYPKLFLSRWIRVPDLIGDEHLKPGVLLNFLNLGTGV